MRLLYNNLNTVPFKIVSITGNIPFPAFLPFLEPYWNIFVGTVHRFLIYIVFLQFANDVVSTCFSLYETEESLLGLAAKNMVDETQLEYGVVLDNCRQGVIRELEHCHDAKPNLVFLQFLNITSLMRVGSPQQTFFLTTQLKHNQHHLDF